MFYFCTFSSFSFCFFATWEPDLPCSALILHAHTHQNTLRHFPLLGSSASARVNHAPMPLTQFRGALGWYLASCSFPPHSLVAVFGYGDPQKWLQKDLRCPRLVSSTCDDDTNTIIAFLVVMYYNSILSEVSRRIERLFAEFMPLVMDL